MCVLVLGEFTELVEPLAGALAQDVSRLGARFGRQQRDLAAVAYALFQHLLCVFGVLSNAVLGRDRLRQVAKQCRHVLQGLTGDLDLTPRHCLYGFHGELIGLAQRLDVAPLTGHHCLDIKRSKAKISHHFDHVKIEKAWAGLCVSHRSVPVQGDHSLCSAQRDLYRPPPHSVKPSFASQQNQAGSGSPLPRGRCSGASHRSIRRRRASNTAIVRPRSGESSPRQTPIVERYAAAVSFTATAPRIPPVAMSAAASIQRIERINDAPAHIAVSGSATSSRRSTSIAGLYGPSASNRRISKSNKRSRACSPASAWGESASTASSIRRESPHRIACFAPKRR